MGDLPNLQKDFQRQHQLRGALAEERLLGILQKNPDYLPRLQEILSEEDFSLERNRQLYESLASRIRENRSVEFIALSGELPPELATTKEDKTAHGFGLAGMREIAERWGGSLETRGTGGRFQLVACLPLDGGGKGPQPSSARRTSR